MQAYWKPLGAFLLFILLQALGAMLIIVLSIAITGTFNMQDDAATFISGSLVVSSVLTIIVLIWPMKMFDYKHDLTPAGIETKYVLLAIFASIIGITGTDVLSALADLPNIMGEQFNNMSMTVTGALAISVIGPIAEEVGFRGAILGYMLRKGVNAKIAIVVSALLFGIIHMNPAQVPFAFVVGLILGVVYYKTGNILLTSLIHILNNSFATMMAVIEDEGGEPEASSFAEYLGSTGVVIAIVASIAALAICGYLLYIFWKRLPEIEYKGKEAEPVSISDEIEKVFTED